MNFIIYIIFVAYLCLLCVHCRSLQMDSDVLSGLQKEGNLNHDHESGGIFSWKKLKPLLKREMQRIRNVKDMATMFNQKSTELASSIYSTENEDLSSESHNINKNEENSFESQITTSNSIQSEINQNYQNKEIMAESDLTEEFADSTTHNGISTSDSFLTTFDFPDNVISDILNQSGDSLVFQALNDNSSKTLEFDEATLLAEGGQIAMLQEVSTIGFELLIDSETKKNLILTELLSPQSSLIDDDDFTESEHEEDYGAVTSIITHSNESDMQETSINSDISSHYDIAELSIDETENDAELNPADSFQKANVTFVSIDEETANNSDIVEITTDEFEIENTESYLADSFQKDNAADILSDKQTTNNYNTAELNEDKFQTENTESNLADLFQKDNVTDVLKGDQISNISGIADLIEKIENAQIILADLFLGSVHEVTTDKQTSNTLGVDKLNTDEVVSDLTDSLQHNITEVTTDKQTSNTLVVDELDTDEVVSDLTDSLQDNVTKVSTDEQTLKTSDFTELDANEIRTESIEPNFADYFQKANVTENLTDEQTSSPSEIIELYTDEITSEIAESFQGNVTKVSTDEETVKGSGFAEVDADEIETEKTESDFAGSLQKDNVTDILKDNQNSTISDIAEIETENARTDFVESVQNNGVTELTGADTKCPDPGWCIFWFILHEDTCAKDSHCPGSLICCMWGCSKTCIDLDNLF